MSTGEAEFKIAGAIAEQIWREQTLSSNRMNWNLSFQGFMMAAFAVVAASEKVASSLVFIQMAICLSAFAVSLFTTFGIMASNRQRSFLRQEYNNLYDASDVPAHLRFRRPFSDPNNSSLGRLPAFGILGVLMLTWLALTFLVLPDGVRLLSAPS